MIGRRFKSVLAEALVVSMMGLAVALLANLASPRGLSLTRNYFPDSGSAPVKIDFGSDSNLSATGQATNTFDRSPEGIAAAHLKEKGLRPIIGKDALDLFRDPQYEQELIVFIDARDDRHYAEGHIPGAYQFDRYYPEKYLPAVLAACQNARSIVVYCTGGNCEDSEFATLTLKEASVPPERLAVYVGGMTEWAAKEWPVEVGERKSGKMRAATP
jgi:rhodanese-related sulfurtransferase